MTLKQRTMKLTGWTSEQYNKEYDKLRNRTRAYERAIGSSQKRNVSQILYYTQKAQKTGSRISTERQAIMSTPSISTGKTLSKRAITQIQTTEFKRYEGLATINPAFSTIIDDDRLSNDQKLSMLRKLADKMTRDRTAARAANKSLVQSGGVVHDFYVVGSDEDMTEELEELYAEMGFDDYDFSE